MRDVVMLLKDFGRATGVTVSSDHLTAVLNRAGLDCVMIYYTDDAGLIQSVTQTDARLFILQVPTFTDGTLYALLKLGKKIILGTHSTICNLQVEGDALERILRFSRLTNSNFAISCPSQTEVEGFNAFSSIPFIYLPNTYSLPITANLNGKTLNRSRPLKISLFCALRPLKNIMEQVAAVALLAKKVSNIELHLIEEDGHICKCIRDMSPSLPYTVVIHQPMDNNAFLRLVAEMDMGLQVSLSETFCYVVFEHMALGVPVVASDSVPYATLIAKYNDSGDMADKMNQIICDAEAYRGYSRAAVETSVALQQEMNEEAVRVIRQQWETA